MNNERYCLQDTQEIPNVTRAMYKESGTKIKINVF